MSEQGRWFRGCCERCGHDPNLCGCRRESGITLDDMIGRMPPEDQQEVEDRATVLISKEMRARAVRKATLPRLPKGELYETPEDCTQGLLGVEQFHGRVWEPAVGRNAIGRVLEAAGLEVVKTDLHDWGLPGVAGGRDFLREEQPLAPNVVTNPPFSLAERFVHHALDLGAAKVALFLRLSFLEGGKRRESLFLKRPPVRVWVMSKRRTLWRADDPEAKETGGALAFAWFVWSRHNRQAPQVGWIP